MLGGCPAAFAQPYTSVLGRFQVDEKKGCAPFTVTVTNLLPGNCIAGVSPCAIDYGDGTPTITNPPLPIMHTYTTAGTYTLKVIYTSLPQQNDVITITVVPNIQPAFEIWSCSGNRASIKVTDNNYDQYAIDYNNDGVAETTIPFSSNMLAPSYTYAPPGTYVTSVKGIHLSAAKNCTPLTQSYTSRATLPAPKINTLTSLTASQLQLDFTTAVNISYRLEIAVNNSSTFQLFQGLYGVNTVTLGSLNQEDNFYCFRLGAYDPCTGATTYSNVVCSDNFDLTAASDVNHLIWQTGNTAQVVNYAITRNGNNYFAGAGIGFDDSNVICKTDYCYQITNNYVGGAKSISLTKCVTSFSNQIPTTIDDVSATVGNGVKLEWQQDPNFTPVNYSIFRSSPGTSFSVFELAGGSPYTDEDYTTNAPFCYRIKYLDVCGNYSNDGGMVCPIHLSASLQDDNSIILRWSGYKGWAAGVKNYVLKKFGINGNLLGSITLTDTTYVDDTPDPNNQFIHYELIANANTAGLAVSVANAVDVTRSSNLYYPTAFTPNGDNLNDTFSVKGQYIDKMNMQIFDRWGALIFTASQKDGKWDGSRDSKPMPPSTYIWRVEITDLAGHTYSQEGTIALIRN